jgi:pimeloyl-ACP methyl ester carboxylesterase
MSTNYSEGPTVVLVHGAFADAASWAPVTQRLVQAGVPVRAVVNPLRGVSSDAAYVASAISQIDGDVLAVGHSYGGMIITNAVPQTTNVVGLVYVAAFAPDKGETLAGIVGRSTDSVLTTAVLESQFPTGNNGDTATELIIDPAKFRDVFTADLPQLESDVYGLLSGQSLPRHSSKKPCMWRGKTCRPGPQWAQATRPPEPTS